MNSTYWETDLNYMCHVTKHASSFLNTSVITVYSTTLFSNLSIKSILKCFAEQKRYLFAGQNFEEKSRCQTLVKHKACHF